MLCKLDLDLVQIRERILDIECRLKAENGQCRRWEYVSNEEIDDTFVAERGGCEDGLPYWRKIGARARITGG